MIVVKDNSQLVQRYSVVICAHCFQNVTTLHNNPDICNISVQKMVIDFCQRISQVIANSAIGVHSSRRIPQKNTDTERDILLVSVCNAAFKMLLLFLHKSHDTCNTSDNDCTQGIGKIIANMLGDGDISLL